MPLHIASWGNSGWTPMTGLLSGVVGRKPAVWLIIRYGAEIISFNFFCKLLRAFVVVPSV